MLVSKKEIDKLVSKVNKADSMKEKRDATTQLKKIKEELIKIVDYNEDIKGEIVSLDNIDLIVDQIKDNLDSLDTESFNIEKKKEMLRLKKNIENWFGKGPHWLYSGGERSYRKMGMPQ